MGFLWIGVAFYGYPKWGFSRIRVKNIMVINNEIFASLGQCLSTTQFFWIALVKVINNGIFADRDILVITSSTTEQHP